MINIEQAVSTKFPGFNTQPALIRRPVMSLLRAISKEKDINAFLQANASVDAIEFIDRVFDYFNFSYSTTTKDRQNIPAQGRVVIIANHPIGSLDGLAILRLVSEVRRDVKIMANDMLMHFSALHEHLIPVDNLRGGSPLRSYRRCLEALRGEQALIVFPAGEVSRAHPTGVKDTRWLPGFLHLARHTGAALLPVHIRAKNSLLFYSASMLYKPLGTALLAQEMFNKQSATIHFRIGEPIPADALHSDKLNDKALIRRLQKHLYKIGRRKRPMFVTEKTIAHPEDRRDLLRELARATLLGETRDQHGIYRVNYQEGATLLREVGRLREIAFRKVGEGTGARRDLDRYDRDYDHLLLWDSKALEVAGSYRIGEVRKLLDQYGDNGIYTRTLFNFLPAFSPYLQQALEMGRSFVNPQYWGKNSLDYLWQGIGAWLRHQPDIRYLIGPVSISASYPRELVDHLVFYYERHYACPTPLATARHPYPLSAARRAALELEYSGRDRDAGFAHLQATFHQQGHKVPVLLKQYAALFEDDGFQMLAFSIDPDFSDCLDGLILTDLSKLKPAKRKRYLGD